VILSSLSLSLNQSIIFLVDIASGRRLIWKIKSRIFLSLMVSTIFLLVGYYSIVRISCKALPTASSIRVGMEKKKNAI